MVQIVTRATRRQYLRPPPGGPFALNRDSPLASGLQAWWPLNHQGRFAYNMAAAQPGGRYDLSLTGTLAQREGPDGGLAHTCSATQYFQGAPPSNTLPMTLGCWFNPDAATVTYTLMTVVQAGSYDGYFLQADGAGIYGGDYILARIPGTGVAFTNRTFVASRWQYALGIFASTTSRTAGLDGNLGDVKTVSGGPPTPDTVTLGLEPFGGTYGSNFAGLLGDCCVWSRALNEADAARLYDPATRWELYYPLGRKTYSFPGATAAGTAFNRGLAEDLAGSDAYDRLSDAYRANEDTLALPDAYDRLSDALRALDDNHGLSDAYARVADALRALDDTAAAQDAYASAADWGRALADTLALPDAFDRLADAARAVADDAAGSDAFDRLADAARAVSDGAGGTDAFDRLSDAARGLAETFGLADAYDRLSDALRAVSDDAGQQDAFDRLADAARAYADTAGLLDDFARDVTGGVLFELALAESLAGTDAYARVADALRAYADTAAAAEDYARVADAYRAAEEAAAGADAFDRLSDAYRTTAEDLAGADAFARVADAYRALTELAALPDDVATLLVNAEVFYAIALQLYAAAVTGQTSAAAATPQTYAATIAAVQTRPVP